MLLSQNLYKIYLIPDQKILKIITSILKRKSVINILGVTSVSFVENHLVTVMLALLYSSCTFSQTENASLSALSTLAIFACDSSRPN